MADKKLFNLLLRSFDEDLTPEEVTTLEQGLISNPELKLEQEKLKTVRQLIHSKNISFKPGFEDRVMNRLENERKPLLLKPEFNRSLFTVFKRVVITGVAAALILFLSMYFAGDALSTDPVYGGDPFSDEDLVSYLLYEGIH